MVASKKVCQVMDESPRPRELLFPDLSDSVRPLDPHTAGRLLFGTETHLFLLGRRPGVCEDAIRS